MELSAVEYRLLCQLAGEPTRVFTKIDFELPPGPRKVKGARDSRARGGIRVPVPRGASGHLSAARRVQGIGRMPSAYGKDLAAGTQAHTRAGISAASAAPASRPPRGLVVHHGDERRVAGRRALHQTNLTLLCRSCHQLEHGRGHRRATKTTRALPRFDRRGCLRNSFQPCGAAAFRGPSRATDFT